MQKISRRHFLSMTTSAAALTACAPISAQTAFKAKVVIIGGGAGGTIAAKYLRRADPTIEVTLIEQKKFYHTCFMSNEVISGERRINSIKFNYDHLRKNGIKVIHSRALGIEPITKKVTLQGGEKIAYDRLIISPGIDFKWNAIEGYDESIIDKMPHAWKAGKQTIILRKQIESMKDGGTVLISVPRDPSRCPVAPYERASQIALYLKQYKPKSKVLIFDAKSAFVKQQWFIQAWQKLYGFGTDNSLIEWIPAHEEGTVIRVDAENMAVYTGEFEDEYTAEVINIIPPHTAGQIAKDSGLVDKSGWCPINQKTFESSLQKDIYVIGDACITLMPKAAQSANIQAQICAQAIVSTLQGIDINDKANKSYLAACYAILGENYGMPIFAVYRLEGDTIQIVKDEEGGMSLDDSVESRKREVANAYRWYETITKEMFDE